MAKKLGGKRTFSVTLHGETRTFKWSTMDERNAIFDELREAGMTATAAAKAIGLKDIRDWRKYRQAHPGPRPSKPEGRRAKLQLRVRDATYDVVCRYAIRNGMLLADALHFLVDKGAEAVGFEMEPKK